MSTTSSKYLSPVCIVRLRNATFLSEFRDTAWLSAEREFRIISQETQGRSEPFGREHLEQRGLQWQRRMQMSLNLFSAVEAYNSFKGSRNLRCARHRCFLVTCQSRHSNVVAFNSDQYQLAPLMGLWCDLHPKWKHRGNIYVVAAIVTMVCIA